MQIVITRVCCQCLQYSCLPPLLQCLCCSLSLALTLLQSLCCEDVPVAQKTRGYHIAPPPISYSTEYSNSQANAEYCTQPVHLAPPLQPTRAIPPVPPPATLLHLFQLWNLSGNPRVMMCVCVCVYMCVPGLMWMRPQYTTWRDGE